MKIMKTNYLYILITLGFTVYACGNGSSDDSALNSTLPLANDTQLSAEEAETKQMVDELRRYIDYGDARNYYNWNHDRAVLYLVELKAAPPENSNTMFYNYCYELLLAGESRQCIEEVEAHLAQYGQAYEQLINDDTYVLFELLAMAYLRLGEQENCQAAHNEYSCILPLQDPALHQLNEGSTKAIELFTLLQNYYPQEKYRWLLNVAYMTLGKHPSEVPKDQKLDYPNWKLEQKNFPRFEEIAMHVGLAENGISGGTCVDDFNGDGWLDVFMTSSGMNDQAKLFLSTGKGDFEDATERAGIKGLTGGLNCIHADYDNDGDNDILILRGGWLAENGKFPNSLLRNKGDGTFDDVTRSAGLLSYHPTQTAAWADFNKDGFLDLFIGNESESAAHPCELYKNNGNGTFTEVAKQHGLDNILGFVKGVVWGDINNDNWPDLYITDVRGNNMLYKNTNGKFENMSKKAGVEAPYHSFVTWFFDVNNDGFQDIFACGYDLTDLRGLAGDFSLELQGQKVMTDKPHLYINNGDETFTDRTEEYGLSKTMYGMGANFGDLDNDGFLDLYIGTGAPEYTTIVPNRMFRNVNGKRFEEVTSAGGFGHIQKGHGVAFADMDKDGDQDIYAVMGGVFEGDRFTNILFENPGCSNNWIVIELQGVKTNRNGIGSKLEITLSDWRKIHSTLNSGGSFGSSNLQAEIGLGKAKEIAELKIHWQNGEIQTFTDIEINQKIRIVEGENTVHKVAYTYVSFAKGTGEHHHHQ